MGVSGVPEESQIINSSSWFVCLSLSSVHHSRNLSWFVFFIFIPVVTLALYVSYLSLSPQLRAPQIQASVRLWRNDHPFTILPDTIILPHAPAWYLSAQGLWGGSVCHLAWQQRILICHSILRLDWRADSLDILAGVAEPVIMHTLTFW